MNTPGLLKLDGVGPVNNRPFTDKLHTLSAKKKKKIQKIQFLIFLFDMRHMTCYTWHMTHDMWHVTCDTWQATNEVNEWMTYLGDCRASPGCARTLITFNLRFILNVLWELLVFKCEWLVFTPDKFVGIEQVAKIILVELELLLAIFLCGEIPS